MNKNFTKAYDVLNKGGVVIFPTDTAFGIGCRIDNALSVKRLFDIRKRDYKKPVPVLVASIKMAEEYVEDIDPSVLQLMKKYWPGGLTIVLTCKKDKVSELVRGGGDTIGIRIPAHKTIRDLIKRVGIPILAPSANFSGGQTPYRFSDLEKEFVSLVDFVLPGRCSAKKASSVIDCTVRPYKILREGAVQVSI